MRIERESGIEFDFSAALSCSKHDAVNRVWPGVDFVVEEPARWIWLEVKNWEPAALPPRRRGGQRRSFLSKMRSSTFFSEVLRAKFIGTSAFLALTNQHPNKDIRTSCTSFCWNHPGLTARSNSMRPLGCAA